jgi:hypothetical protein
VCQLLLDDENDILVSHEEIGDVVQQRLVAGNRVVQVVWLTGYHPSFGMFARLGRRSRRRWIWRTRALPRRRPFRGSREKGKGMIRNSPA